MTYSEIKIRFIVDYEVNFKINIFNLFSDSGTASTWSEKWKTTRTINGTVAVGIPTEIIGERSAINFVNAFELDYNFPVQYEVSRIGNEVIIKSLIPDQTFTSAEVIGDDDYPLGVDDFEITNYTGTIFKVNQIDFKPAASDQCSKVGIEIETSKLATKINLPFTLVGNTENPFSFDYLRNQTFSVDAEDALGNGLVFQVKTPPLLLKNNFSLALGSTPSGGTLAISNVNSFGLNLEYSLDEVEWQTEPLFSGLEVGAHNLYVRDGLGCSFNTTFLITEFNVNNPYFYYSKSNSIRMAERVDFALIPKNDENTLSCESQAKLPYREIQEFLNNDVLTMQFKSNYENNLVRVKKENGSIVTIPINQKTNNIGVKDKRDAIIYKYDDFRSGIYFIGGNNYDFNTNVINGTYVLNGILPNWVIIGNFIVIDSLWYQIESIQYVEDKNADVAIITKATAGSIPLPTIIGGIFNIQDYEVYEFSLLMSDYSNQNFNVEIEANDTSFGNKFLLSEKIKTYEKIDECLEINYFNIDNNDVVYQTGIEHLLRLPFTKINGYFDDNSENNKTDSTILSLSATMYEGNEFIFEPVTKEIWRKLAIALSHKFVFIDGVGYVKDGEIEVEGPLEDSNLYVVKAKMLKTGKAYSNKSIGSIDLNTNDLTEIPGLIAWDGGFIEQ